MQRIVLFFFLAWDSQRTLREWCGQFSLNSNGIWVSNSIRLLWKITAALNNLMRSQNDNKFHHDLPSLLLVKQLLKLLCFHFCSLWNSAFITTVIFFLHITIKKELYATLPLHCVVTSRALASNYCTGPETWDGGSEHNLTSEIFTFHKERLVKDNSVVHLKITNRYQSFIWLLRASGTHKGSILIFSCHLSSFPSKNNLVKCL